MSKVYNEFYVMFPEVEQIENFCVKAKKSGCSDEEIMLMLDKACEYVKWQTFEFLESQEFQNRKQYENFETILKDSAEKIKTLKTAAKPELNPIDDAFVHGAE